MEGLSSPAVAPPRAAAARAAPRLAMLRAVYPGFLVAATVALASTWLSQHYGAPVMLFALLFGMAFQFLHEEGRCVSGIEFSSKAVLRLGVALLGARITAAQIMSLGAMPIATVVVAVAATIAIGYLAARALGQSRSFGILSGGSVGICGASAALAIASVLPRDAKTERDTILTVVTVTALSTLAMILYPLIATGVGLDHVRAGIFLGGTIHDVAQVVGAGYTISPETGDIATYVKLLRVAMLLPVVFIIAFVISKRGAAQAGPKPPVPLFLLGFAALVAVNSLGLLPKPVTDAANDLSRWSLVTAIAALGMKTSFKELIAVGWRPIAVMLIETFAIGAIVMAAVQIFH
ncbi:putative sulfate exporter family transporter [Methylocapsa acidiphila]|uniref:YeiH family protein n=1 Tax=Methylocapsa acidiphila TaxID=133552 RepID=UPI0018DBEB53